MSTASSVPSRLPLAPPTCRPNLTPSLSESGLCGGFDVPIHRRTDHDRASLLTDYTRKLSVDSAGGSSYYGRGDGTPSRTTSTSSECSDYDIAEANLGDITSLYSDDDCQEVVKQILSHEHPIRIVIKLHITEDKFTQWECVLSPQTNMLYVSLPDVLPPEASKQSFISLLEFAEEKLDVDGVVLCMRRSRTDRARLLESFLIMGFQPLSRKSPLAPPTANDKDSDNIFLIYHIED